LIVGSNNIGKTALLEAIYLLVNQENLQSLIDVLTNRGEISEKAPLTGSPTINSTYELKYIFNGFAFQTGKNINISSNQLSLKIEIKDDINDIESNLLNPLDIFFSVLQFQDMISPVFRLIFIYNNEEISLLVNSNGSTTSQAFHKLQQYQKLFKSHKISNNSRNLQAPIGSLVTINNWDFVRLASLWDEITLTPKEENVISALKILEPNVERISFTSKQTDNSGVLIKIKDQPNPLPIGIMGAGMQQMLTLAMVAVTSENGYLLVDEIETGLYYEKQVDMWRLIFGIAQKLNIQVFATTHSWDCVAAFNEAIEELADESIGKLFRLDNKYQKIRAVEYTPEVLSSAVRQGIEVR